MDNPKRKRPQDSSRISLTEKWEVDYWTKKFGVSDDRLRQVVEKVGHGVDAVENYLKHNTIASS